WDAGQQVAIRILLDRVATYQQAAEHGPPASGRHAGGTPALHAMPPLDVDLVAAMRETLAGAETDPAFAAEALVLPGEATLADEMAVADPEAIHAARDTARGALAAAL